LLSDPVRKRPRPRSEGGVCAGGRYWDRTSDLFGVNADTAARLLPTRAFSAGSRAAPCRGVRARVVARDAFVMPRPGYSRPTTRCPSSIEARLNAGRAVSRGAAGARGATVQCGARGPRTGSPWTPCGPRTTICRHRGRLTLVGVMATPTSHAFEVCRWSFSRGPMAVQPRSAASRPWQPRVWPTSVNPRGRR
jgi:hypothetical protein